MLFLNIELLFFYLELKYPNLRWQCESTHFILHMDIYKTGMNSHTCTFHTASTCYPVFIRRSLQAIATQRNSLFLSNAGASVFWLYSGFFLTYDYDSSLMLSKMWVLEVLTCREMSSKYQLYSENVHLLCYITQCVISGKSLFESSVLCSVLGYLRDTLTLR